MEGSSAGASPPTPPNTGSGHGFTDAVVRAFLNSNLSLILVILAAALGVGALLRSPREEDPQIVVPMADVFVEFPGRGAEEVERLVAGPLERILYQIDGVEYVYSMSRPDRAIITVRFYVGEDRERSLVKIFKKIDENLQAVPPGVTGWVIRPVEIDDVPIVTLSLTGPTADEHTLRRVGEEMAERLAAVPDTSRAYVIGGPRRVVHVHPDPDRLRAYGVTLSGLERAIAAANVAATVGDFRESDRLVRVEAGRAFAAAGELEDLVLQVAGDRPVFLKDVAEVVDGPEEQTSYVRHGWGPAAGFDPRPDFPGALVGGGSRGSGETSRPAVTVALAKKKGANAVWVAREIMQAAERLRREVIPDDIQMVLTRNYGLNADEKVNELIEALFVAVVLVIVVLTLGLGWRESIVVAVAVPVVFGLTLAVNMLCGFSINRVTLFALILSLGLLVDDPIVDVENITRHFSMRRRASRAIVLEAVAEIRPPLITATLAVIVSFLPMSFITGMMGPYMRPMALNVPVSMVMSMLVAFTITPWLSYHMLRRRWGDPGAAPAGAHEEEDPAAIRRTLLYRLFEPLMAPLLRSRRAAWSFLAIMGLLTAGAAGLAATRHVPLKMLPFDNRSELLVLLDFPEGTTLERADATVREIERFVAAQPEVVDFTSYVGLASPMDFNGLVRHYYLRQGENVAEVRLNLVGKKNRRMQSHAIGLRMREELTALARRGSAVMSLVELPPGPPVIATVTAEIYGRPDHRYEDLTAAAGVVRARLEAEPGVADVDTTVEAEWRKLVFEVDREKAALHGVTVSEVAATLESALAGRTVGTIRAAGERQPLEVRVRLRREDRSAAADLGAVAVAGAGGAMVPLSEIGRWVEDRVDQTIYHKNLQRVAYVFAETVGRPPAEVVMDVQSDRQPDGSPPPAGAAAQGGGWVASGAPRPMTGRSYLSNGGGIGWAVADGIRIDFAGEGEWKITLDVFRDLGLAFGAALAGIYVLLVAQTGSFVIPLVVMLAIPLTVLGIMPGFWLLNALTGGSVGGFADPVFFTATGMIGMIALAGIVTRDAIILVDFIHLSLARGRSLFDAIMESRVVRLRPILLTTATAMISAVPIAVDPIFSGLAWSLIFGLLASTVFTLFVIPVACWLMYAGRPGRPHHRRLDHNQSSAAATSPARSALRST